MPVPEKMPQVGAHKYLVLLTIIRLGGAAIAIGHRPRAVVVPLWCRLAAGRDGDGAVWLRMSIG